MKLTFGAILVVCMLATAPSNLPGVTVVQSPQLPDPGGGTFNQGGTSKGTSGGTSKGTSGGTSKGTSGGTSKGTSGGSSKGTSGGSTSGSRPDRSPGAGGSHTRERETGLTINIPPVGRNRESSPNATARESSPNNAANNSKPKPETELKAEVEPKTPAVKEVEAKLNAFREKYPDQIPVPTVTNERGLEFAPKDHAPSAPNSTTTNMRTDMENAPGVDFTKDTTVSRGPGGSDRLYFENKVNAIFPEEQVAPE